MTDTLSLTYASLVTLSGTADNPTTIAASGLLNAGLYADSLGAAWMITNAGSVLGAGITLASAGTVTNSGSIAGNSTSSSGRGILLSAGGSVTNQSTGTISGRDGIAARNAALTVVNAGSIDGAFSVVLLAGGTVTNQSNGTISGTEDGIYGTGGTVGIVNTGGVSGAFAIVLDSGGSVTNDAAATISGTNDGIFGTGGPLDVVNAGSIAGSFGIVLKSGGSVTNQTGGTISATDDGIYSTGGTAGIVNAGSLSGLSGIVLKSGGSVTNQSDGTIRGDSDGIYGTGGTVAIVNAGSISGDDGILLRSGGTVTNNSGGIISGLGDGILGFGDALGVVNAGTISGSYNGIYQAGGSVTNQSGGTIRGTFDGIIGTLAAMSVINAGNIASYGEGVRHSDGSGVQAGVALKQGGDVTNLSNATISGYDGITGGTSAAAVIVVNAGTIEGGTSGSLYAAGIILGSGGTVTNQSSGTISGYVGINAAETVTVVNLGNIEGGNSARSAGVDLQAGGNVTNQANATISGLAGVFSSGGTSGTVVNAGLIAGATTSSGIGVFAGSGTNVTNQSSGTISGFNAVADLGTPVTVVNAGIIAGSTDGTGVKFVLGGSVANQNDATISGYDGIYSGGVATTVVNAGTIAGNATSQHAEGIFLGFGGSVTNQGGGTISGYTGFFSGGDGFSTTLVNAGIITGNATSPHGTGVFLSGSGLTNQSAGTISGYIGVYGGTPGGVTVVNAGTIAGIAYAVKFAPAVGSRLIIDPGATFSGAVTGGNTIGSAYVSTLELASGSSAGTLTGLGTQFIDFSSIAFDPGSDWFVAGDTSGLVGTISGFAPGDTIDITGITVTGSSYTAGVLTLTDTAGKATLNLPGTFTTSEFAVTNTAGGAEVTLVCFCAGTHIRTPHGETKVEALVPGDTVITARGEVRPIVWIGTGRVLATRGRRGAATPVIVRKGALADNVPHRDLRVTKAHSLLIDDVLIPVEFLVNHRSILWDDRAQEVAIYHIELATHDVLVADGAPAETYRDDGNRWLFQNANSGWNLPPQQPCAPVLTGGNQVDAIWRRLLDRAEPRAGLPLTGDADLHLLIDGTRLDAVKQIGEACVFHLPAVPTSLHIVSRSAIPAELGLARDPRPLGAALRRITVRQAARFRTVEARDTRLSQGFHAFEPDNGFRWTDGDAAVPAELFAGFSGKLEFVLQVAMTAQYPAEGQVVRVA